MKWTTLSTTRLVDRPWVGVREDFVRFENGLEQDITVVENKVGVHILAINDKNEVTLVDKPSYPAQLESSWELPGGVAQPHQDLMKEAIRESAEEVGLIPNQCNHIFTLHKGTFRLQHPSYIYLGTDLIHSTGNEADPNEIINQVVCIPIEEALAEVGGKIVDAATVAALYWYAYHFLPKPT